MVHIQYRENSQYSNHNIDRVDYLHNLKITYQISQTQNLVGDVQTCRSLPSLGEMMRHYSQSAFGESRGNVGEGRESSWVNQFPRQLSLCTLTSQERHHAACLLRAFAPKWLSEGFCLSVQREACLQTGNVAILGRENRDSVPPGSEYVEAPPGCFLLLDTFIGSRRRGCPMS